MLMLKKATQRLAGLLNAIPIVFHAPLERRNAFRLRDGAYTELKPKDRSLVKLISSNGISAHLPPIATADVILIACSLVAPTVG